MPKPVLAGVMAIYTCPQDLILAVKQVRAVYQHFDAYTPYPVHGLDEAQGLKRSILPFVTWAAGLTGGTLGFLLQYWTSVVDWPLIVGGKPLNSWPAFVPVMFECTILFAGLATVAGMFILNGLPNIQKKTWDPRLTRDRFAVVIEAHDDRNHPFDESKAQSFLKTTGAQEVRSVYHEKWFET